jgi:hypothetical protein
MVSGSELAVLGTLGGATVSGIVSLVGIKLKQDKESSRRYGEVFLEERAERLVSLYDAFARCENSIDRLKHGNRETAFDFIDIERAEVEEEIVGTFM